MDKALQHILRHKEVWLTTGAVCVDVCPYIHKENRDPLKRRIYKQYMGNQKKAGYRAPVWFARKGETSEAAT